MEERSSGFPLTERFCPCFLVSEGFPYAVFSRLISNDRRSASLILSIDYEYSASILICPHSGMNMRSQVPEIRSSLLQRRRV